MAKSLERMSARSLRRDGKSVKDIARHLGVAPSSVSIWCRDIRLTTEQVQKLSAFVRTRGYAGRMKGARMHHERRLRRMRDGYAHARNMFGECSERDLLIAGIALYWAEGARKGARRFKFANSDPAMIRLMLRWLKDCFDISGDRLRFRVLINEAHRDREHEVMQFWCACTGFQSEVFHRTIFIHTKLRKVYENHHTHYGTLHVDVIRSTALMHRIHGLIAILAGRSFTVCMHDQQ